MQDLRGFSRETIVFLVLLGTPLCATAQVVGTRGPMRTSEALRADQYVMTGKIEFRQNQFVLVDDNGQLTAHLVPKKSVDLSRFTGQIVKATVREPMLRTTSEPRLWVERVEPVVPASSLGASRSLFDANVPGQIRLAQYTEPMQAVTMSPTPVSVTDVAVSQANGLPGRVWISIEALGWAADSMDIPPFVTTSPLGTPREQAGVLGQPGTQILFGGEDILGDARGGGRLRAGVWFSREHRFGIEGEYFDFQTTTDGFVAASTPVGAPILARPFFNVNPRDPFTDAFDPPARQDSQLISYPGVLRGAVVVAAGSRLDSFGIALRGLLADKGFCEGGRVGYSRVDMLVGYRHMGLREHVAVVEQIDSLQSNFPVSFEMYDLFGTRNSFNGLDLGMAWQTGWGKWSLDLLAKTAWGSTRQEVLIQGATRIDQPNVAPAYYQAGLLALPSNIGSYSRDRISVIPEFGLNLGFAIIPRLRATVGYTWIYWAGVVRPGDQIDLDVNPDQLPPPIVPGAGAARPEFVFRESNYWTHGLSIGLEGRW